MPAILSCRSRRQTTTPYKRSTQSLTPFNRPPLPSLLSTTIEQFLHSSNNRKPLLSEQDYQTTVDALSRNVRLPISPIFRRWKEIARLRNGRLFIGERLVVSEESLPAVLVSLPFSLSVQKMIRSSQRSYCGVPEALVRAWHAQLSHFRDMRRDDEKENAFTPRSIRDKGTQCGAFSRKSYPSSRLAGQPLSVVSNVYPNNSSFPLSSMTSAASILFPSKDAIVNHTASSHVDDLYVPPELAYDNPAVWVGGPGFHKTIHSNGPPEMLIKLIPFNRSSYRPTFMVLVRTWTLHTEVSRPNKRSVIVEQRELNRRLTRAVIEAEKAKEAAKLALGVKEAMLSMPGGFS
ncbi:hypothetical protein CPB85DRAFT_1443182 [Mucidula mucida]|nr:hypothetical protein CPB85DRAFT_1443182 [Mucidula mucida]